MKKLLLVSVLSLCVVLTGCGDKTVSTSSSVSTPVTSSSTGVSSTDKKEETPDKAEGETQKDVEVSVVSCTSEPYTDEQGLFDRKLTLKFKVKNNTDKPFGYTTAAWEGTMSDGSKLQPLGDISDLKLTEVEANSEKEANTYFLVGKDVEVTEFTASYPFLDYNQEYWDDIGKLVAGEFPQDEYIAKYSNIESIDFKVTVE